MKNKKLNVIYLFLQIALLVGLLLFAIGIIAKLEQNYVLRESKENFKRFLWCLLFSILPYILKKFNIRCTKTTETYFLLAIITHFIIGGTFHAYNSQIFSSVVHLTNSFLIGIIIYGILLRNTHRQGNLFLLLTTMACVVLIGVLWELVEFSIDGIWGANMQRTSNNITGIQFVGRRAIYDTIADLAMDSCGGLFAGVFSNIIKIKNKPVYIFFELKLSNPKKAVLGETSYFQEMDKDLNNANDLKSKKTPKEDSENLKE